MFSEVKPIELYIDKAFLNAFFVNIQDIESRYSIDILHFFSTIRNFDLITNYSSWEEMKGDQNLLIRSLINLKLPRNITYMSDLPIVIKSGKFFDYSSSPYKMFFIEDDFSDLSKSSGFEFISSINFNERWHTYLNDREDSVLQVTNKSIPKELKFESWQKVKSFAHPLHSILIFDLYVLSEKSNEKVDDNLLPFLEIFLSTCVIDSSLDLMIITEKVYTQSLEIMTERVKSFILKKTKVKEVNLSIVIHDKKFYPVNFQGLSFRRVYTNYFVIKLEKGLNCFHHDGKAGKIQDVRFEFIFNRRNCFTVQEELEDIRTYVGKVPQTTPYDSKTQRTNFYPNKHNRLIN